MKKYHDEEWGVPEHDDRRLFAYLVLEAMQCGLSWQLILQRREVIQHCFADFDYDRLAGYSEADTDRILHTEGMIRSRQKVQAMIHNARCFRKIREQYGSFDAWLWSHSGDRT
ncbi:MAG: DNA-3-methyladenine glycosylase I, partial [Solobacterium sp.]|nr:DNA-3-methyladenine glycosylase I [Solobacterium sp.]